MLSELYVVEFFVIFTDDLHYRSLTELDMGDPVAHGQLLIGDLFAYFQHFFRSAHGSRFGRRLALALSAIGATAAV